MWRADAPLLPLAGVASSLSPAGWISGVCTSASTVIVPEHSAHKGAELL